MLKRKHIFFKCLIICNFDFHVHFSFNFLFHSLLRISCPFLLEFFSFLLEFYFPSDQIFLFHLSFSWPSSSNPKLNPLHNLSNHFLEPHFFIPNLKCQWTTTTPPNNIIAHPPLEKHSIVSSAAQTHSSQPPHKFPTAASRPLPAPPKCRFAPSVYIVRTPSTKWSQ